MWRCPAAEPARLGTLASHHRKIALAPPLPADAPRCAFPAILARWRRHSWRRCFDDGRWRSATDGQWWCVTHRSGWSATDWWRWCWKRVDMWCRAVRRVAVRRVAVRCVAVRFVAVCRSRCVAMRQMAMGCMAVGCVAVGLVSVGRVVMRGLSHLKGANTGMVHPASAGCVSCAEFYAAF